MTPRLRVKVNSGQIRKWGNLLSKGLLAQEAPRVAKGALAEILKAKGLNVKMASQWVQDDVCLWDQLNYGERQSIIRLRGMVQNMSWLTAEWVIDAIRSSLPAVASLFMGWAEGGEWLRQQVEIIKKKVEE